MMKIIVLVLVALATYANAECESASSPCLLMEASNSPKNCSSDAGIIPWSESDDQDACRNAAYVIDTSGSDKFMYFTIPFPAVGNGDRSVWIAMTTLAGRPELQICKDYSTPCSSWSDPWKALDGVQRFDRPANQGAQHREIRVRADMWSRYRILWYTDEDTAGEPVIPLEQGFPQVGLYEPDAVRHHLYKWTIAKPTDTYARDALLNHGLEVSIESEYGDVEMLVSLKDKPSTSQKKQDLANCLFSSAYYGTRDIVTLVYYSSDVKTCFDACFARSSDNNHCDMYVKVFTDGPSYDALYEVNAQWRNLDVELTLGEPVLGSAMAGFWRQYHVGNKEGRDITFVLTPIAGDAWLVANKKQNPQKIGNYNGFQRTTAIDRVAKGDYPKNLGAIPKDIYIGVSGSTIRYTNKNCTFSLVAYAKSGPPIKLEEGLPAGNKVSKDEEIHYVIDHDNHATNRRVDDSLKRITITVTATGGGYVALAVNKCTDEECTSRIPTGTSLSDSDYYQDGQATSNPVIVIRDPCAGSSDYCKFMVTVRGLAAQSFTSVSFYTPWSVVSLREAIPFTGQVDQGQYDCFQYTLLQDSKDVEIIVTEIDGDPDVFVSKADPNDTGVTLPNRYNYTWGSLAVGLDIVTIRENDPNACKVDLNENFYCNYLMCVHGYTNSSYSIVIKDNDNTPVLLSDGSPLQGHVDSHTHSYYEFEINEPTLDAHVAVENLSPQGDPDLYVKLIGNVPPADDAPVVSQTSYDYRAMRQGSDDLWIDHSTTAFKTGCNVTAQVNAGTTFRCIMQIAVFGYKSSDYQITAVSSIRPIELNMGRPVTREVPYRYFAKFTVKVDDPSKDLNIAITPQGNGDPDLYVSTDPSLFDCATPQPYTHAVLLCSTPMLASKLTGQQPDAVNINAGQAYDFPAPNATNPYVYVLVLAFTRSKFTIVATQPSKREIATLLPSSPVAGSLHSKDINYYELDARGVNAGKLDLTLKTFSGLAALYVKNMSDTAEENLPMYCCAACLEVPGHSTLQPSPGWNDPHACNQRSYLMDPYTYDYYQYSSYCDMVDIPLDEYQNRFIIAVRGSYYDNTTYTLEAHFPGDVQTLVPGIQVCASVQKATFEYYDMFFFRNSEEDFTVSASIYPLNYAQGFRPKIYLKACVDGSCTRPNATNYDAVGDNFGIVQLIATNETCGIVCYFQLAVTADADIRYRLKANLDHSWANRQQLTEGIPVPDRLQSGEINYYVFEPPFDAEELTITATPTNLDSQLYMYMKFIDDGDKVINAPSASNHDYFDYSWGGNCQIVATKDDAKWDTSKVAFVALKAVKTSEYLISASTAFYILQSGESMDEEVFPGLYEYFLFTNDNTYGEDIQLDVTHPSAGDTTVCFAYNWTESFHTNVRYRGRQLFTCEDPKAIMLPVAAHDSHLVISQNDPHYCSNCNYLVAVTASNHTRTTKVKFNIMLTIGNPVVRLASQRAYTGFLGGNEEKYFSVQVRLGNTKKVHIYLSASYGNPVMYLKTDGSYPDTTDYDITDGRHIEFEPSTGVSEYIILVYADDNIATKFEISARTDDEAIVLQDGQSEAGFVNTSSSLMFTYDYQESDCDLVFTIEALAGSAANSVQLNIARAGTYTKDPFCETSRYPPYAELCQYTTWQWSPTSLSRSFKIEKDDPCRNAIPDVACNNDDDFKPGRFSILAFGKSQARFQLSATLSCGDYPNPVPLVNGKPYNGITNSRKICAGGNYRECISHYLANVQFFYFIIGADAAKELDNVAINIQSRVPRLLGAKKAKLEVFLNSCHTDDCSGLSENYPDAYNHKLRKKFKQGEHMSLFITDKMKSSWCDASEKPTQDGNCFYFVSVFAYDDDDQPYLGSVEFTITYSLPHGWVKVLADQVDTMTNTASIGPYQIDSTKNFEVAATATEKIEFVLETCAYVDTLQMSVCDSSSPDVGKSCEYDAASLAHAQCNPNEFDTCYNTSALVYPQSGAEEYFVSINPVKKRRSLLDSVPVIFVKPSQFKLHIIFGAPRNQLTLSDTRLYSKENMGKGQTLADPLTSFDGNIMFKPGSIMNPTEDGDISVLVYRIYRVYGCDYNATNTNCETPIYPLTPCMMEDADPIAEIPHTNDNEIHFKYHHFDEMKDLSLIVVAVAQSASVGNTTTGKCNDRGVYCKMYTPLYFRTGNFWYHTSSLIAIAIVCGLVVIFGISGVGYLMYRRKREKNSQNQYNISDVQFDDGFSINLTSSTTSMSRLLTEEAEDARLIDDAHHHVEDENLPFISTKENPIRGV